MVMLYEAFVQAVETGERWRWHKWAREYADSVGKGILRIGMKRGIFEPPNGDVTLDIDPKVIEVPGGVWGDERAMPFADRAFGVCFNEHTLEHLRSLESVAQAVSECARVADYAVLLVPGDWSITNKMHPDHWLDLLLGDSRGIFVHERTRRGGPGSIGQALLVEHRNAPAVMRWEEYPQKPNWNIRV